MRTALIVGAGVGGLAAAIALRKAGWQVQILERAASQRELGFALMLAPNAMRALATLGLAERVKASGFVTERGEIRKPNGSLLRRFDLAPVHRRLGAPTVCVLRTALHGALLEAVEPSALRLESRVVGFEAPLPDGADAGDGVRVRLQSGEALDGRVLIGADGVKSVVRRALHPDEPPVRESHLVALRGLAHGATSLIRDVGAVSYLGRGCEAGCARAGGDNVYWFLSGRVSQSLEQPPGDPRELFARLLAQFHEPFREMVANTASEDLRPDVLFDRVPLRRWGAQAVTLLGDAAHPMLPNAGQGAAQALEDAVALGQALGGAASEEAGLRAYERARIGRTATVVRLARRNAWVGTLDGAITCALRDLAIRMVPSTLILKSQIDLGRAAAPS